MNNFSIPKGRFCIYMFMFITKIKKIDTFVELLYPINYSKYDI